MQYIWNIALIIQQCHFEDEDLLNIQRNRSAGFWRNTVSFFRGHLTSFLFNLAIQLLKITERLSNFNSTRNYYNRMDDGSIPIHDGTITMQKRHNLLKKMFVVRDYAPADSKLDVLNDVVNAADLESPAEDKLSMSTPSIFIRSATISDTDLILTFIKELARFEEMESSVVASAELLQESLFPSNVQTVSNAEVVILEVDGQPAGFALYFYNFSTFLGKKGLYIEDLYVRQQYRGKTYGKQLLKHVCQIALKKNCGRVEWWCLDWNEQAIYFYTGLGAEAMKDWTVFRLSEDKIRDIGSMPISIHVP